MFLLICKLYICIQNVFGHIFYSSRLHLYWQFWQFEVQKLAYMLILAAGGSSPYLSSVPPLRSVFREFFFDVCLTLDYDYMCSETDFTQEQSYFHLTSRIPNSSSLFAAALSQNGRIAV